MDELLFANFVVGVGMDGLFKQQDPRVSRPYIGLRISSEMLKYCGSSVERYRWASMSIHNVVGALHKLTWVLG